MIDADLLSDLTYDFKMTPRDTKVMVQSFASVSPLEDADLVCKQHLNVSLGKMS